MANRRVSQFGAPGDSLNSRGLPRQLRVGGKRAGRGGVADHCTLIPRFATLFRGVIGAKWGGADRLPEGSRDACLS